MDTKLQDHFTELDRLAAEEEAKIKSWLTRVKTRDDADWHENGLRFSSEKDAFSYGAALVLRWPLVVLYAVEGSTEQPNVRLPVPSDRYGGVNRGPWPNANEGQWH